MRPKTLAIRTRSRMRHKATLAMTEDHEDEGPIEIAIVGDLTDSEAELTDRLLSVQPGGEVTIYFDSPGGSPYCAVSLMTLIKLRKIQATGIVTGECSSATLWPFAACRRRIVTPFSVMLFHPMRWQSEENVGLAEAAEWARHFGQLEQDMDALLAHLFGVTVEAMHDWINPGRYVSGRELAAAGMAELMELDELHRVSFDRAKRKQIKRCQWEWLRIASAPARKSTCAAAETTPLKRFSNRCSSGCLGQRPSCCKTAGALPQTPATHFYENRSSRFDEVRSLAATVDDLSLCKSPAQSPDHYFSA